MRTEQEVCAQHVSKAKKEGLFLKVDDNAKMSVK